MRMRKKKNQAERLSALTNLLTFTTDELRFDADVEKQYIDFTELFGNSNPVYLEIGAGKGQFAIELAKRNPDINVVAVEKTDKVVLVACENAAKEDLHNLVFLNINAEYLPRYIPKNSISRLYLNFSCPYPKHTYANKRLTNPFFLNIYRDFLKKGAEIHQKTDNMHFFEYSIESFTQNGFALKNISLDLHNSGMKDNIETEYEQKFVAQGLPIYRLEAVMNK